MCSLPSGDSFFPVPLPGDGVEVFLLPLLILSAKLVSSKSKGSRLKGTNSSSLAIGCDVVLTCDAPSSSSQSEDEEPKPRSSWAFPVDLRRETKLLGEFFEP